MISITERHARLLAEALTKMLGAAERRNLAYLRCLPGDVVDALPTHSSFTVEGNAIFAVTDQAELTQRQLTADQAVERREDKDQALLLLIDPHRAGAGLDGIYSAGREITERDLFEKAIGHARENLKWGLRGFGRKAVRVARRIGQRPLLTPWEEFDFLVELGQSDRPG